MNVKAVLHGIVKRIDDDLYRNENNRVVHKTEEFIDLYRNAYSTMLPDDYMYEHIETDDYMYEYIEKIITEIEMYLRYNIDDYDYDDIDDLIDELMGEITIELDQNTGALLDWMSSNPNRYAIAEDLYQKGYKFSSLFDLMQVAQSIEIEEVTMSILNDLREMLEEIEEEE